jgi:hypothetical protein
MLVQNEEVAVSQLLCTSPPRDSLGGTVHERKKWGQVVCCVAQNCDAGFLVIMVSTTTHMPISLLSLLITFSYLTAQSSSPQPSVAQPPPAAQGILHPFPNPGPDAAQTPGSSGTALPALVPRTQTVAAAVEADLSPAVAVDDKLAADSAARPVAVVVNVVQLWLVVRSSTPRSDLAAEV